MSAETEKRCGTCKWFSPICTTWGSCGIPVPDCLDVEDKAEMHGIKAGKTCPCWEPKPCAETESQFSGCTQPHEITLLESIAKANGMTYEQLRTKLMNPLDLVIYSPEGPLLVATYEFRPKQ